MKKILNVKLLATYRELSCTAIMTKSRALGRHMRIFLVFAALALPNCVPLASNTPRLTRIIEDYNCRKGYSACRTRVVVEVVHVYED